LGGNLISLLALKLNFPVFLGPDTVVAFVSDVLGSVTSVCSLAYLDSSFLRSYPTVPLLSVNIHFHFLNLSQLSHSTLICIVDKAFVFPVVACLVGLFHYCISWHWNIEAFAFPNMYVSLNLIGQLMLFQVQRVRQLNVDSSMLGEYVSCVFLRMWICWMMIHVDIKFWYCDKQTCPLWMFIHCKSGIFAGIHLKAVCISGLMCVATVGGAVPPLKLLSTACIWWFDSIPLVLISKLSKSVMHKELQSK